MISASSRAFVLKDETMTWRSTLRNAIIEGSAYLISIATPARMEYSVRIRDTELLLEERLCESQHGGHIFNRAVGGANVVVRSRFWRKNADNHANGHPGRESPCSEVFW